MRIYDAQPSEWASVCEFRAHERGQGGQSAGTAEDTLSRGRHLPAQAWARGSARPCALPKGRRSLLPPPPPPAPPLPEPRGGGAGLPTLAGSRPGTKAGSQQAPPVVFDCCQDGLNWIRRGSPRCRAPVMSQGEYMAWGCDPSCGQGPSPLQGHGLQSLSPGSRLPRTGRLAWAVLTGLLGSPGHPRLDPLPGQHPAPLPGHRMRRAWRWDRSSLNETDWFWGWCQARILGLLPLSTHCPRASGPAGVTWGLRWVKGHPGESPV